MAPNPHSTDYELYEGIWIRPGTSDKQAVKDVEAYSALHLKTSDTVLDLGAHIGAFVQKCALPADVSQVVAYEPEQDNFTLLHKNCYAEEGVALRNYAIGDRWDMVDFYPSRTANQMSGTLRRVQGRQVIQVQMVPLSQELNIWRPTVLKIDIEGGEYGLGEVINDLPKRVRAIAIEFHIGKPELVTEAKALFASLQSQGFASDRKIDFDKPGMASFMGRLAPRTIVATVLSR